MEGPGDSVVLLLSSVLSLRRPSRRASSRLKRLSLSPFPFVSAFIDASLFSEVSNLKGPCALLLGFFQLPG